MLKRLWNEGCTGGALLMFVCFTAIVTWGAARYVYCDNGRGFPISINDIPDNTVMSWSQNTLARSLRVSQKGFDRVYHVDDHGLPFEAGDRFMRINGVYIKVETPK